MICLDGDCPSILHIVVLSCLFEVAAAGSGTSNVVTYCPDDSSVSGRRLAGTKWYCEEYEKNHFEAMCAAVLVLIAALFERLYHKLHHRAEHAYVYGQYLSGSREIHEKVARQAYSSPLLLILFVRCSGEFMVLGFIAFLIWSLNQQSFFDVLSEITASDIRLPASGVDYFHILEKVHIQLFVANVLYFALCFLVVRKSNLRIQDYEYCRNEWVNELMTLAEKSAMISNAESPEDRRGLQAQVWAWPLSAACFARDSKMEGDSPGNLYRNYGKHESAQRHICSRHQRSSPSFRRALQLLQLSCLHHLW